MTRLTRKLPILLALILWALMCAACGGKDDLAGNWYHTKTDNNFTSADYLEIKKNGDKGYLVKKGRSGYRTALKWASQKELEEVNTWSDSWGETQYTASLREDKLILKDRKTKKTQEVAWEKTRKTATLALGSDQYVKAGPDDFAKICRQAVRIVSKNNLGKKFKKDNRTAPLVRVTIQEGDKKEVLKK